MINPQVELARYLYSLNDLYPHGVPKVKAKKPVLIVEAAELAKHRELLNSIIEKGMKLSQDNVDIRTTLETFSSPTLSFGIPHPNVTLAPTLTEIATNPEAKKKFWEQLKTFIQATF